MVKACWGHGSRSVEFSEVVECQAASMSSARLIASDADEAPWDDYSRDRLPRGWTYLLGRGVIEGALREAGARVASLSLGRPDLLQRELSQDVSDVYYYGGALLGHPSTLEARSSLLLMRWIAVPSEIAPTIAEEVRQVWLPRGCAWAAAALSHGNGWSAAEHRWRLNYDPDSGLQAIET